MRNKKLMLLMLVVLLCYCILQCALFTITQRRAILNDLSVFHQNLTQPEERQSDIFSQPLENLRDYAAACHQRGIPVTVVDPVVLQRVQEPHSTEKSSAVFFKATDTITLLATIQNLWQNEDHLLLGLRKLGFSILSSTEHDHDTRKFLALDNVTDLHTHYLFQRGDHIVHQVILFPQKSGYLWYGRMVPETFNQDITFAVKNQLSIGQHAGVLDSFETVKVTLDGLKLRVPHFAAKFQHDISNSRFVQCNYTRAELFQSLYGRHHDVHVVQQFRDTNQVILAQAKSVLDRLGIKFWLSSGTCLGWYRQCDSIHYSGDVDIGIWIKDYNRKLIPAMIDSGLSLKHVFGKESDSYELTFENHQVKLDIFFFYEEGPIMWNGGTQARTGQKFKYIFPRFTLCWTEFLGLKVRIPCETAQYLEANYGIDWFIPVENWDWKSSPPNVVENGYWPPDEMDKVILVFDNS